MGKKNIIVDAILIKKSVNELFGICFGLTLKQ